MMVWTVANQKGGVGKTTTAVSLAGLMADRGYNVLLVDMDPHCSLGYYLGLDVESLEHTGYDVFVHGRAATREQVKQSIHATSIDGIDIMPANMAMATLDRKFGHTEGMGLILRHALNRVKQDYDVVLVDCPPVLGVLMVNALAASERVLVPVQTEFLALKGLERMIMSLELMKSSPSQNINYMIVPTMFDKRTKAANQAMVSLAEQYGNAVWRDVIPVDTRFRDASLEHLPPSMFAGHSRGVVAYRALLDDLIDEQVAARNGTN
ncbi:ParA family protein [Neiella marina]|uniref:ParA family protein n=1 Tax=Neiella holothuriorum TaxID=2870530 RepID=A0ABS7EEL5_9GAMM|nr:ParA family protein [Neiella holothuriorum]MBW8190782.1 ParA family protein [Neiella holothuriorum]